MTNDRCPWAWPVVGLLAVAIIGHLLGVLAALVTLAVTAVLIVMFAPGGAQ